MNIAVTNALLPERAAAGVPYQVHQLANALMRAGTRRNGVLVQPAAAPMRATGCIGSRGRACPLAILPFFMAFGSARTDFSSFDVVNVHGDNYLLGRSTPVVRTFHGTAADELKNARTLRREAVLPADDRARAHRCRAGRSRRRRFGGNAVRHAGRARRDSLRCRPRGVCAGRKERTADGVVRRHRGRPEARCVARRDFHEAGAAVGARRRVAMVCEATGTAPGVRRYGRVSTERTGRAVGSAWAFCLPSTYEGFGVPYIEAMAARTAVVATSPNAGARRGARGRTYGSYVADGDLAAELTRILSDAAHRADLEHRGAERARDFAWDRIAATIRGRLPRRGTHRDDAARVLQVLEATLGGTRRYVDDVFDGAGERPAQRAGVLVAPRRRGFRRPARPHARRRLEPLRARHAPAHRSAQRCRLRARPAQDLSRVQARRRARAQLESRRDRAPGHSGNAPASGARVFAAFHRRQPALDLPADRSRPGTPPRRPLRRQHERAPRTRDVEAFTAGPRARRQPGDSVRRLRAARPANGTARPRSARRRSGRRGDRTRDAAERTPDVRRFRRPAAREIRRVARDLGRRRRVASRDGSTHRRSRSAGYAARSPVGRKTFDRIWPRAISS